jgi:molecular chaperone GrpE
MADNNPSADAAAGTETRDNAAAAPETAAAGAPGEPSAVGETIDPTDHARVAAEYKDTRAYGISAFARDILAVADNMDRALQALDVELREKADAGIKALLDGVELTERELHKALEKHGVKKFEPVGEKFDPNLHQAMFEIPDPTLPAGTVAQVVQPGYMIGERMLRPALVGIAKGGPKPVAEPPANDNVGEPSRDPQRSV